MRVGVIQSSFIPWRGYFDFIASVDIFVFHDDIQFTKGGWRNRNKIKTASGPAWLTVPVYHRTHSQLIYETQISNNTAWARKHLNIWRANYQTAAYFDSIMEILSLLDCPSCATISQLNITLIRCICNYLGIDTPMIHSSELKPEGKKTDRLINLLKKLNAKTYLSGPSADVYLEKDAFRLNGIQLEYKSYDYAPYTQLWGEFIGEVTVLDLIANRGPDARNHIRSHKPDTVVIKRI